MKFFEWIQVGYMYDLEKQMKRKVERMMLALRISEMEKMVSARVTGIRKQKGKLAKMCVY